MDKVIEIKLYVTDDDELLHIKEKLRNGEWDEDRDLITLQKGNKQFCLWIDTNESEKTTVLYEEQTGEETTERLSGQDILDNSFGILSLISNMLDIVKANN